MFNARITSSVQSIYHHLWLQTHSPTIILNIITAVKTIGYRPTRMDTYGISSLIIYTNNLHSRIQSECIKERNSISSPKNEFNTIFFFLLPNGVALLF